MILAGMVLMDLYKIIPLLLHRALDPYICIPFKVKVSFYFISANMLLKATEFGLIKV